MWLKNVILEVVLKKTNFVHGVSEDYLCCLKVKMEGWVVRGGGVIICNNRRRNVQIKGMVNPVKVNKHSRQTNQPYRLPSLISLICKMHHSLSCTQTFKTRFNSKKAYTRIYFNYFINMGIKWARNLFCSNHDYGT